ncbi:VanZ family protein [Parabacteroides sp. PF5-6]|uniref:VanZ family protein n=1 Tax=Parabacteroides sp. PF5-6 TaxID=1742403 RepID=UPI002405B80E|nr:VanZ family protein [Parabacteroides sp. PF5-6]MDF9830800.1 VanZ family protein [Parabacteroides sp. PF5-6]
MWYYLKKYPFSWIVILAVIYLSFFNPPAVDAPLFPYMDKVAHFCMYGGLSGVLWLEHIWNHRKENERLVRGLTGATLLPILFGGLIELAQHYLTTNRQGDFDDFFANTAGVIVATLIAWFLIWPLIRIKN